MEDRTVNPHAMVPGAHDNMSLFRRGKIWWIDLSAPGSGERVRRSSGTDQKELAQEYHDRTKAELWKQSKLNERPSRTWEEAASRWLSSRTEGANAPNNVRYIEWLTKYLKNRPLESINRDLIDSLAEKKAKEKRSGAGWKDKGTSVSLQTVNRYMSCLRSILRASWEWGWIDAPPPVVLSKSPPKRIRFLTRQEADRLMKSCPDHMGALVSFALATGLRQKNILELEWSQVDVVRKLLWIHADQAKGGKDLRIPLSDEAARILEGEKGKHEARVFTYKGRPMETVGGAFDAAVRKAKIENFRFHDLRHTWASWHVQAGTPLAVLQELGGWSNLQMVMRYAHLGENHLAEWASNARADFGDRGTFTAQPEE
ncbi:MAG: site-specific integrase [Nitrospirota bacterium]|nr:site-specific integrase [Nitrospirota bacterium]